MAWAGCCARAVTVLALPAEPVAGSLLGPDRQDLHAFVLEASSLAPVAVAEAAYQREAAVGCYLGPDTVADLS